MILNCIGVDDEKLALDLLKLRLSPESMSLLNDALAAVVAS